MNIEKLKQAEAEFFRRHPEGFDDPSLADVMKRHSKAKLTEFAQQHFGLECGSHVEQTIEHMVKTVSRSSMVSMFEKPKFRDFCARLDRAQKGYLVDSLIEYLHGDQQAGFEAMVDLLKTEKLAKWSLITIIPNYYHPRKEVFVKPTTAKGVIAHFEVPKLVYKAQPTWEFYKGYRSLINRTKKKVDKRLAPSNAAFSGFLMMSL